MPINTLTLCLYLFESGKKKNLTAPGVSLFAPQVKLPGIEVSGIADGVPSVVLNLIWSIILHFQAGSPLPFHHHRHYRSLKYVNVIFNTSLSCPSLSDAGKAGDEGPEEAFVFEPLFLISEQSLQ